MPSMRPRPGIQETQEGARVYILDSGIDAEHPDLSPNLNTSLCTSFVPDEGYNVDNGFYFNHGTHVAGIMAAANNAWVYRSSP